MLEFTGNKIASTHGPLIVGSAVLPVRRVKYWDVPGEGELVGEPGGRPIVCTILLHDGYVKFEDFRKAVVAIEKLQGKNGKLKETGTLKQDFDNVTFEGFDPIPLGGQEEPGPLQDVGVLTRVKKNGDEVLDNGWFAAFFLRFYQLQT